MPSERLLIVEELMRSVDVVSQMHIHSESSRSLTKSAPHTHRPVCHTADVVILLPPLAARPRGVTFAASKDWCVVESLSSRPAP